METSYRVSTAVGSPPVVSACMVWPAAPLKAALPESTLPWKSPKHPRPDAVLNRCPPVFASKAREQQRFELEGYWEAPFSKRISNGISCLDSMCRRFQDRLP